MRNQIDPGIIGWFDQRGQLLQQKLTEVMGKPISVTYLACEGYPEDGLHIRVMDDDKLLEEQHVWQNGLSVFNTDFLERCFERLENDVRSGNLQRRHGLVVITYARDDDAFFVPEGLRGRHEWLN